jgi:non-ribosomal peptide synthetase component E (peptide arylation enzyme)
MLGPSSVPDRFVETTALPLSTTGKIQKNVVRDRVVANELA